MSDLAGDLCRLVPEWDIEWSDGSSACRYGRFVVLFDSHSNVIAYDVPDRGDDAELRTDLEENDAEKWILFNDLRWDLVVDEPDGDDDGEEYLRSELGL